MEMGSGNSNSEWWGPTQCYGVSSGRRIVAPNGGICVRHTKGEFSNLDQVGLIDFTCIYMILTLSSSHSNFCLSSSSSLPPLNSPLAKAFCIISCSIFHYGSSFSCFWVVFFCLGLYICTWVSLVHLELLSAWLLWVQGNLSLI